MLNIHKEKKMGKNGKEMIIMSMTTVIKMITMMMTMMIDDDKMIELQQS